MLRSILKHKNILLTIGAYLFLVFSFFATLIGTYAWFAYDARANSTFRGTAVNKAGDLKIGLYSDILLEEAEDYNLVQDLENEHIYWSKRSLESSQINYFLEQNNYATNFINPVTSGSIEANGELNLHPYPSAFDNSFINLPANKKDYVFLPLVFSSSNQTSPSPLYIKEANVRSDGNLYKAVRIHSSSSFANFLFSPGIQNDGYDNVGGILNLNRDTYYDYYSGMEYAYGEFDSIRYMPQKTETEEEVAEPTTFNAVHRKGIYALDTENSIPKKAYYYGYESVLNKSKVIAELQGEYTRVDFTVYLEGWNTYLHNSELLNYFNLDLSFEFGG